MFLLHSRTDAAVRARSIQPKFPEISVQNSLDRFGPTGKVSKKRVHLLSWSSFPSRTGWNFGWMDRALQFLWKLGICLECNVYLRLEGGRVDLSLRASLLKRAHSSKKQGIPLPERKQIETAGALWLKISINQTTESQEPILINRGLNSEQINANISRTTSCILVSGICRQNTGGTIESDLNIQNYTNELFYCLTKHSSRDTFSSDLIFYLKRKQKW